MMLASTPANSAVHGRQVYRMAAEEIGCSLAEAAESSAYERYLREAAADGHPGLHVVYINTSLRTKALAHAAVPTITCTSSNVVNTVLQVGRTSRRLWPANRVGAPRQALNETRAGICSSAGTEGVVRP